MEKSINIIPIADTPIDLASNLTDKVLEEISPYFKLGNLIPKDHHEIISAKDFYILKNEINKVLGCFEIRKHQNDEIIWELGTVWGPGYLDLLIEKFESLRKEANVQKAFAITAIEKNAQNFAERTNGIVTQFPTWFDEKRKKDDKYFIEWE